MNKEQTQLEIEMNEWKIHLTGMEWNYFHAFLPGNPQIASSEKTGDGVPGQMVDPSLFAQLSHDGVDPREACLSLFIIQHSIFNIKLGIFKKLN